MHILIKQQKVYNKGKTLSLSQTAPGDQMNWSWRQTLLQYSLNVQLAQKFFFKDIPHSSV